MSRSRKGRIVSRTPAGLSDEERIALLDKRVAADTREFAAILRSRTEFEAVLVRGSRVSARNHVAAMVVVAGVALAAAAAFSAGSALTIAAALSLPAGYGLFWLFLVATGGEQVERLAIDEEGRISSSVSGRPVDRRADVLKVLLPAVVIAVAAWITLGLIWAIVWPPQPSCDFPATLDKEFCRYVPGMGHGTALTVGQTKALERVIRALQLIYSVGFLAGGSWFLHHMLTGRWVADVRPVRRRGAGE